MRQQAQANLSSFLLVGPRGAGKTTLVLMLYEAILADPELAAVWLPLRFREEQFEVCSLRDLLAAAVRSLAEEGVAGMRGGAPGSNRQRMMKRVNRSPSPHSEILLVPKARDWCCSSRT